MQRSFICYARNCFAVGLQNPAGHRPDWPIGTGRVCPTTPTSTFLTLKKKKKNSVASSSQTPWFPVIPGFDAPGRQHPILTHWPVTVHVTEAPPIPPLPSSPTSPFHPPANPDASPSGWSNNGTWAAALGTTRRRDQSLFQSSAACGGGVKKTSALYDFIISFLFKRHINGQSHIIRPLLSCDDGPKSNPTSFLGCTIKAMWCLVQ